MCVCFLPSWHSCFSLWVFEFTHSLLPLSFRVYVFRDGVWWFLFDFFLLLLILPMLFYSLFWKRNKTMWQKKSNRRFAKMNAKISLPLLIFMIFCFLDFSLLSKLVFPNFVVRKQFLNQGSNTFLKSDFKLFCFWLHFEINTTIMFIFLWFECFIFFVCFA